MKSVALHNLGCKVNSYEMDVMQQILQKNGYKIVQFDQKADIYVINTCTVTNIADRKSRQMLHRAKKLNPDAVVVAVGCYVQTGETEIEKDPCIDLAIGNNRKSEIVTILEEFLRKRGEPTKTDDVQDAPRDSHPLSGRQNGKADHTQASCRSPKTLSHTSVIDIGKETEYEEMQLEKTAEHTRAYIKIQDGCNQFCSYCIIPFARGRVRSRRPEQILEEVRRIADAGYKEVVITGIHLSSYGLDFHDMNYNQAFRTGEGSLSTTAGNNSDDCNGDCSVGYTANCSDGYNSNCSDDKHTHFREDANELLRILTQIHEIDGITRIRLGSLEPRIITENFAARLAALPKICPHFHLSLQSGCDSVLRRMNRQYTTDDFRRSVSILRKVYDNPAITTDVITGFPGETEEEFAQTVRFLEEIRFFEMHVFPYSKREGTAAAKMAGQLTEKEKKARSAVLLEMDKETSHAYRAFYVGKDLEVLFEQACEIDGTVYQLGHTRNYMRVAKLSDRDLTGQEVLCHITGFVDEETLLG